METIPLIWGRTPGLFIYQSGRNLYRYGDRKSDRSDQFYRLILSAIVSNASGNVTVQINPLTTMAADVALTLAGQGNSVTTAADNANTLIQNYFGLTRPILTTAYCELDHAQLHDGLPQASANVSAILAGISQLALNNGVSTPDLVEALIQDVASDGQFDGLASKATISVL